MKDVILRISTMNYIQIILMIIVLVVMWLPLFGRLNQPKRLLVITFVILPGALFSGSIGGSICIFSFIIRTLTLMFRKKIGIEYTCSKCGFSKVFEQTLKLYKCPQCGNENLVE